MGVILKSKSIDPLKFLTVPLYLPLNASGTLKGVILHSQRYSFAAFATHELLNSGNSFVVAENKSKKVLLWDLVTIRPRVFYWRLFHSFVIHPAWMRSDNRPPEWAAVSWIALVYKHATIANIPKLPYLPNNQYIKQNPSLMFDLLKPLSFETLIHAITALIPDYLSMLKMLIIWHGKCFFFTFIPVKKKPFLLVS